LLALLLYLIFAFRILHYVILGLVFNDVVVFYGDKLLVHKPSATVHLSTATNDSPREKHCRQQFIIDQVEPQSFTLAQAVI